MTSSKTVHLIAGLLVMTFDIVAGQEVKFISNGTSATTEDFYCSVVLKREDYRRKKIGSIEIFGVSANFDEKFANVNAIMPTVSGPGNKKALGIISERKGFLRLQMAANCRFLKYVCRVVMLENNHKREIVKCLANKANSMDIWYDKRCSRDILEKRVRRIEETLAEDHRTTKDCREAIEVVVEHFVTGVRNLEREIERMARSVNEMADQMRTMSKRVDSVSEEMRQISQKVHNIESTGVKVSTPTTSQDDTEKDSCDAFRIRPDSAKSLKAITTKDGTKLLCDAETDGGGWIVFQRRVNGKVRFNRPWKDYENGFGRRNSSYWLGLRTLSSIVATGRWELRVDLKYKLANYHAKYAFFKLGDRSSGYKLSISGYSGNAGDSLMHHNNQMFSTVDVDNDAEPDGNCSLMWGGSGWWYSKCLYANLNGKWKSTKPWRGINWGTLTSSSNSATFAEMKVRKLT